MPRCAKCGESYDADYDGCPNCSGRTWADVSEGCGVWLAWSVVVIIVAGALLAWMGQ